jgi:hypothetical protein
MVGKPAGPTTAPGGSPAVADCVAAAGVAGEPVVPPEGVDGLAVELPPEGVDGLAVELPPEGVDGLAVEAAGGVLAAPPAAAERATVRKSMCAARDTVES